MNGRRLSHYEMVGKLGEGGMGERPAAAGAGSDGSLTCRELVQSYVDRVEADKQGPHL
jgi:hypothetical protein